MKFSVSSTFALEGIIAQELRGLGMEAIKCETGRVTFEGTAQDAARACIWLRSADRVSLLLAEFPAQDFDTLYDGIRNAGVIKHLGRDSRICIEARCVKSRLMSQRDVQRIGKKAVIDAMQSKWHMQRMPESGNAVFLKISILKDVVSLTLDLCAEGLHKRGYRVKNAEAPLRETLAAALLLLSDYDGTQVMCDPFCGSGTIGIEAALIARGIAPGARRKFAGEDYPIFRDGFIKEKERARQMPQKKCEDILCSDISGEMTEMTRFHAERAGVGQVLTTACRDAREFESYAYCGRLVTNPPYGERLMERNEAARLLGEFSGVCSRLTQQLWTVGILTPEPQAEKILGLKALSRRKLYNADIPCMFYTFT